MNNLSIVYTFGIVFANIKIYFLRYLKKLFFIIFKLICGILNYKYYFGN